MGLWSLALGYINVAKNKLADATDVQGRCVDPMDPMGPQGKYGYINILVPRVPHGAQLIPWGPGETQVDHGYTPIHAAEEGDSRFQKL